MDLVKVLQYYGFSVLWEAKRLNWVAIAWIVLVSTLLLVLGSEIPAWTLPSPHTYSSFC